MATGFFIASAITSAVGGARKYKADKRAAKDRRVLGAENRRLFELEADENIRRTIDTQRIQEGTAKVQVGASGFNLRSSLDSYVNSMESRNQLDIDWMRTAKVQGIAVQEREANARYRSDRANATAGAFNSASSVIGSFGSARSAYNKYGWGFK